MKEMVAAMIKAKTDVPVIMFWNKFFSFIARHETTVDVIGIDWKTDFSQLLWADMNHEVAVQGNLDPTLLFGDWSLIEKRAKTLLESVNNRNGFIFNLGHGIFQHLKRM